MRPVVNFEQELTEMARSMTAKADLPEEAREVGLSLIGKVRERAFGDFSEFSQVFLSFLEALRKRNLSLSSLAEARQAWQEALQLLREDHWKKYAFDADSELSSLSEQ